MGLNGKFSTAATPLHSTWLGSALTHPKYDGLSQAVQETVAMDISRPMLRSNLERYAATASQIKLLISQATVIALP